MTTPLLSILIPTVVGRESEFASLRGSLEAQRHAMREIFDYDCTEIIFAIDNKEMTIGEKRERLYQQASGKYSLQIDDDDDLDDEALFKILGVLALDPDCVTYQEFCTINNVNFKSNHSLNYNDWEGDGIMELSDGFHFHRTPFFKSVIKTEIAKSVPIQHCRFGEDHQWARALKPHLKIECHLNDYIYVYNHTSTPFNERYGINQ